MSYITFDLNKFEISLFVKYLMRVYSCQKLKIQVAFI